MESASLKLHPRAAIAVLNPNELEQRCKFLTLLPQGSCRD